MKISRPRSAFKLGLLSLFLMPATVLSQVDNPVNIQIRFSGEFRSNVARQPNQEKDNDIRLNLFFSADKQWQFAGHRKIALAYDFQHYRYGEFSDFTRYDQTVNGQFGQNLGERLKLSVSDELRLRFYPSNNTFNYIRNVFDLSLKRRIGERNDFSFGYQNWLKNYADSAMLTRYLSHRPYLRFNHEFAQDLNLTAKIEYQNHRGNLYAGSTAPEQPLNVIGNRFVLWANLDKVFGPKLVSAFSYKYELDLADDFDIDNPTGGLGDEDSEEFVAEDSDFGYAKHQGSVSVLFRANRKTSLLFFYLFYTKGFDYWRVSPGGPTRRDQVFFFSNKLRFRLSKRVSIDIRHIFEANQTNLDPYDYAIHAVSAGVNFTR